MQKAALIGFFDEMQKMAASKGMAGYMQSRRGTRPYRVSTLLQREQPEQATHNPEMDQPDPPENAAESGEGGGGAVKMAKVLSKERKEKAIGAFAKARPYVAGGFTAGVPAALLGGVLGGKKTAKTLGVLGAAAGVTNEALKDWAEKHKRKRVAKEILGED